LFKIDWKSKIVSKYRRTIVQEVTIVHFQMPEEVKST